MELFIVYTNESSLLDENMRQLRGQFRFWSLKLENSFFANSLVMAWMVQVVTNFVVHSITAPLSLLQVPRQQRSITAQHCLPPAPLTAGLLLCSIGSLDFLGVARKLRTFPEGQCRWRWSGVPCPQCLCSTCRVVQSASLIWHQWPHT